MNFKLIEGAYPDFEKIHDDFVQDYIFSTELSNKEIKKKYEMSYREFYEFANEVKKEYNISRRPSRVDGKYCYLMKSGNWSIQKMMNGKLFYIGEVPSEEIALKIVELCKNAFWNIDVCKEICRNWREYVEI